MVNSKQQHLIGVLSMQDKTRPLHLCRISFLSLSLSIFLSDGAYMMMIMPAIGWYIM